MFKLIFSITCLHTFKEIIYSGLYNCDFNITAEQSFYLLGTLLCHGYKKKEISHFFFFYFFRKHKHNCFCIQEVVSGLRQPVGAVHCGDGSHRLFILEKEGYVKIFSPEGDILKEPFLDIHKLVQSGIKVGFFTYLYLFIF